MKYRVNEFGAIIFAPQKEKTIEETIEELKEEIDSLNKRIDKLEKDKYL